MPTLLFSGDLEKADPAALVQKAEGLQKGSVLGVDLSQVDFVGSGFIQTLVKVHHKIKAGGGRVVLLNPNDFVAEILRIARVHEILEIRGKP